MLTKVSADDERFIEHEIRKGYFYRQRIWSRDEEPVTLYRIMLGLQRQYYELLKEKSLGRPAPNTDRELKEIMRTLERLACQCSENIQDARVNPVLFDNTKIVTNPEFEITQDSFILEEDDIEDCSIGQLFVDVNGALELVLMLFDKGPQSTDVMAGDIVSREEISKLVVDLSQCGLVEVSGQLVSLSQKGIEIGKVLRDYLR